MTLQILSKTHFAFYHIIWWPTIDLLPPRCPLTYQPVKNPMEAHGVTPLAPNRKKRTTFNLHPAVPPFSDFRDNATCLFGELSELCAKHNK